MRRATGPTSSATRSFISPAALLVNVIASIPNGDTRCSATRYATRCVSTRVLPEPAPATTSIGAVGRPTPPRAGPGSAPRAACRSRSPNASYGRRARRSTPAQGIGGITPSDLASLGSSLTARPRACRPRWRANVRRATTRASEARSPVPSCRRHTGERSGRSSIARRPRRSTGWSAVARRGEGESASARPRDESLDQARRARCRTSQMLWVDAIGSIRADRRCGDWTRGTRRVARDLSPRRSSGHTPSDSVRSRAAG